MTVLVRVVPGILSLFNFEEESTCCTSIELGLTLAGDYMTDDSEELVDGAVNVESRCDGNQVLLLHLELSPVCTNVDLSHDVTRCVQTNNERLGGTEALRVRSLAV